VTNEPRCQRPRGEMPCLVDTHTYAGLKDACPICSPHLDEMRHLHGWTPIGRFWRSDNLHPVQMAEVDRLISERTEAMKHE
jgi:hypothetical protein